MPPTCRTWYPLAVVSARLRARDSGPPLEAVTAWRGTTDLEALPSTQCRVRHRRYTSGGAGQRPTCTRGRPGLQPLWPEQSSARGGLLLRRCHRRHRDSAVPRTRHFPCRGPHATPGARAYSRAVFYMSRFTRRPRSRQSPTSKAALPATQVPSGARGGSQRRALRFIGSHRSLCRLWRPCHNMLRALELEDLAEAHEAPRYRASSSRTGTAHSSKASRRCG